MQFAVLAQYLGVIKKFIKKNKIFFVFFLIFFLAYLLWWLSFYPGVLTQDSLNQWKQAQTLHINDAHPIFLTIFMVGLGKIFNSPAIVSFLQIILASSILAWGFSLAKAKKVSNLIIIPVLLWYILMPQFGFYFITIWKDILFSIFFLAILIFVYLLIIDNENARKKQFLISLPLLLVAAALIRYNGLLLIILVPLALVPFIKLRKIALISFAASVVGVLLFNSIAYPLFHVLKLSLPKEGIKLKLVQAMYQKENPNFTLEEKQTFEKIVPEEAWKRSYFCGYLNDLYFNEIISKRRFSDVEGISDPALKKEWNRVVWSASIKNLDAIYFDKECVAEYLLGTKKNLYRFAYDGENLNDYPFRDQSRIPFLRDIIIKLINRSSIGVKKNYLFWSSWPSMLICLLALFLAVKRRLFGTLSFALINMVNFLATILVVPAIDLRYVYPIILSAPLLVVLYFLEGKMVKKKINN